LKYNVPNTWAALGHCYEALGDLQEAEQCYNMVANENPRDFDSRLALADILEKTNRRDRALEIIEAGSKPPLNDVVDGG
jgi:tetratricopeptide (TPR) repeat protein